MNDRAVSLVRAELVDAVRDFADVFRQKAAMEMERCENIENMAIVIEGGGAANTDDVKISSDWEKRYRLLEMLFNERTMRVHRLLIEHGGN